MLWLFLSLLSAFSESLRDISSKYAMKRIDEYIAVFGWSLFSLLFLSIPMFFTKIPEVDLIFWGSTLMASLLMVLAQVLYMKAIKLSPLSLTIPMLTFSPLFVLTLSPLLLGEFPSFFGFIGMFLVVFGTYLLKIKEGKGLEPIRALFREKGPIFMLLVAFLWGIIPNFQKVAVQHSNVFFSTVMLRLFIILLILPLAFTRLRKIAVRIKADVKYLVAIGLFSALDWIFYYSAMRLAIIPYIVSVKRTSVVFSSAYGFLFFKERYVKERLTGVIIMIIGVFLISCF